MSSESNHDPSEDFRVLWEISTEDIRFFKSQQYSVATYALLLDGGIFALASQTDGADAFLIALTVATAAVAWLLLYSLQTVLHDARSSAATGKRYLSTQFRDAVGGGFSDPPWHRPGDVEFVLGIVVAVGAGLTIAFVRT